MSRFQAGPERGGILNVADDGMLSAEKPFPLCAEERLELDRASARDPDCVREVPADYQQVGAMLAQELRGLRHRRSPVSLENADSPAKMLDQAFVAREPGGSAKGPNGSVDGLGDLLGVVVIKFLYLHAPTVGHRQSQDASESAAVRERQGAPEPHPGLFGRRGGSSPRLRRPGPPGPTIPAGGLAGSAGALAGSASGLA